MPPPDCSQADVFCAALVTDTLGVKDHGSNQDAWLGLEESQADKIVDHIAYIESIDTRDYDRNIAYFAEKGYDVIVTSGIALQDETLRAADLYPDSVFVGIHQPRTDSPPNLISITFPEDQMGFIAGALASRLTKTGVAAGVCETSGIDSMWRYCEGFRAGASYFGDGINVLIEYREDGDRDKLFVDEAWGYDTASRLIRRGADVVFAAGGVTGQGALRAATNAGVFAIGAERNQAAGLGVSGKGVVTSLYGQTSFEVREVMRLLRSGQISEDRIGQIRFIPLGEKFPESLGIEAETLRIMLWDGRMRTNVLPEKP
ncbi:MAG: BMP family ABC transporter substrate-binding protein [Anaerolineaceae bacterium]|jgi:basic membrane protein A|nr:MAG: BMP family ABC transporter substrate-binding protein [Anaerolineaceae bacterium]